MQRKGIPRLYGDLHFLQYTVVADISVVAVTKDAPMDRTCLLGCGIITGYGAAVQIAEMEEGSGIAVFGAGCVGVSVVQGAVQRKARKIIVNLNPGKKEWAESLEQQTSSTLPSPMAKLPRRS